MCAGCQVPLRSQEACSTQHTDGMGAEVSEMGRETQQARYTLLQTQSFEPEESQVAAASPRRPQWTSLEHAAVAAAAAVASNTAARRIAPEQRMAQVSGALLAMYSFHKTHKEKCAGNFWGMWKCFLKIRANVVASACSPPDRRCGACGRRSLPARRPSTRCSRCAC